MSYLASVVIATLGAVAYVLFLREVMGVSNDAMFFGLCWLIMYNDIKPKRESKAEDR